MATLILTEKPSVARDFAQSLGARKKGDGFVEGEGFVITWAVGHLLELFEPHDYDQRWKWWNFGSLPILPQAVRYKPIESSKKQLRIVHRLLARKDIDRIVIATDAGREGEVIARTILYSGLQGGDLSDEADAGSGDEPAAAPESGRDGTPPNRDSHSLPPLYRFWTSQALTPNVIADVMAHLKEASEYDRLWRAGQARQIADWLIGMNFSRAATLKFRRERELYSIGRVQTAVLALIVDRKRERDNFKPEPYWVLKALFKNPKGAWWGTWFKDEENRFLRKEEAEAAAASLEGAEGRVKSVKREKKKQPPPQLFSLTDLQREANAKYGYSAKETLDLAQKLYEDRKCLSYPRTDSRVLGEKNVDMARKLVKDLGRAYPDLFSGVDPARIHVKNKRVFNDAKLTDHHALVPMAPIPPAATPREARIYDLVLKRFAAAFHPDYEYEATQVITEAARELFRTTGQTPLVPGWKAVYDPGSQDDAGNGGKTDGPGASSGDDAGEAGQESAEIPALERGDPAAVTEVKLDEKTTLPPPDYNEALLLKDMTNPSRYVTEEELQKIFKGDVGLGTQATRAQIIETIISREYVLRDRKKLIATEKGCYLIDAIRSLGGVRSIAMPEETARWEMQLERVAFGEGNADAFIAGIRKFVEDGVRAFKSSARPEASPLGKCPACGGRIIEGNRGYGCDHWRIRDGSCKFVVWNEIDGRKIGRDTVRLLLEHHKTPDLFFEPASGSGKRTKGALELVRDPETALWAVRFIEAARGSSSGEDTPDEPGSTPAPKKGAARKRTSSSQPKARKSAESGRAPKAAKKATTAPAPDVPPAAPNSLGTCPRCGGRIVEGRKGFGCANWKDQDGACRFVVWKNIAGRDIPPDAVRTLLKDGRSPLLDGFVSESGETFSARLRIGSGKTVVIERE